MWRNEFKFGLVFWIVLPTPIAKAVRRSISLKIILSAFPKKVNPWYGKQIITHVNTKDIYAFDRV